ncbi:unnamed protein product [Rangifer tarandus platyrhynchus]|uniref:Uncharacterized protein n=2 Tax=Rangifer tarandus platyrhynchus TaxID=3082113 RepID=A0ABN9A3S5_RANTA|nr:unnamed protein product [Rangifer tarandus platyrhynchus]
MSLRSQEPPVSSETAMPLPFPMQLSPGGPQRSEWEPRGSGGSGGLLPARCQPVALLLPHRVSPSPLGCPYPFGCLLLGSPSFTHLFCRCRVFQDQAPPAQPGW